MATLLYRLSCCNDFHIIILEMTSKCNLSGNNLYACWQVGICEIFIFLMTFTVVKKVVSTHTWALLLVLLLWLCYDLVALD